jgi:hypothetical protein
MILDEMSAPLGQDRPARGPNRGLPLPTLIRCAAAALVLTFTGWAMMVNGPSDTQEAANKPSSIQVAGPQSERIGNKAATEEPRAEPVLAETVASPATRTITIIDGTSGKRQEIVIPALPHDEARVEDPGSRASLRPKPK